MMNENKSKTPSKPMPTDKAFGPTDAPQPVSRSYKAKVGVESGVPAPVTRSYKAKVM